jgi:hypothetical protein
MANRLKGEVELKVPKGPTLRLVYDIEALCQVEDKLDIGALEIFARLYSVELLRLSFLRTLLWAGLQMHHADAFVGDAGVKAVGELIPKLGGITAVLDKVRDAFTAAFPKPKEDGKPPADPPKRRTTRPAAGTGGSSGASG